MGEIAEGIVEGFQCSHCGICFEDPHGYPVLCKDCFLEQRKHGKPIIPEATLPERPATTDPYGFSRSAFAFGYYIQAKWHNDGGSR